jgi:integrase
MALSDAKVRNAKPQAKPYKITDGEGMFLFVAPSGSKYWWLKYHFAGKEKLLALGVYPAVSLGDARELRAKARTTLARGDDPGEAKKAAKRLAILKTENAFETVAREWLEQRKHELAEYTFQTKEIHLERHLLPKLGKRPIPEITASEILSVLRVVEQNGTLDTAGRVMQMCGQIFRYAIATGRAERNPVPDLKDAIKSPVRKHYSYLKAADLPEFLRRLEGYDGAMQTRLALRFLLLTFVRTNELRAAEWAEIDFDKAEWRIPAERMKMRELHIVPLSRQAVAVLRELQKYTGNRQHLFPNQHNPVSFN